MRLVLSDASIFLAPLHCGSQFPVQPVVLWRRGLTTCSRLLSSGAKRRDIVPVALADYVLRRWSADASADHADTLWRRKRGAGFRNGETYGRARYTARGTEQKKKGKACLDCDCERGFEENVS